MKEIGIGELRELQMQILDYVDAFCRKHDIKYTISGGTLLGAVRHGGYIPWDDDMDIQMLRSEYIRFLEVWQQQQHPYEFICVEYGNGMGYPFGKIFNPKTITITGKLCRTGVFIDVFPLDFIVDNKDFVLRHRKNLKLNRQRCMLIEQAKGNVKNLGWKTRLRMFFTKRTVKSCDELAREMNKIAQERNKEEIHPFVFEMVAGTRCKSPMPSELFEDYTDVAFENRKYMSVSDSHTYLKLSFGDYMVLPPLSKRISHSFKAFWLEQDN